MAIRAWAAVRVLSLLGMVFCAALGLLLGLSALVGRPADFWLMLTIAGSCLLGALACASMAALVDERLSQIRAGTCTTSTLNWWLQGMRVPGGIRDEEGRTISYREEWERAKEEWRRAKEERERLAKRREGEEWERLREDWRRKMKDWRRAERERERLAKRREREGTR